MRKKKYRNLFKRINLNLKFVTIFHRKRIFILRIKKFLFKYFYIFFNDLRYYLDII